jgi:hypothetical protein
LGIVDVNHVDQGLQMQVNEISSSIAAAIKEQGAPTRGAVHRKPPGFLSTAKGRQGYFGLRRKLTVSTPVRDTRQVTSSV